MSRVRSRQGLRQLLSDGSLKEPSACRRANRRPARAPAFTQAPRLWQGRVSRNDAEQKRRRRVLAMPRARRSAHTMSRHAWPTAQSCERRRATRDARGRGLRPQLRCSLCDEGAGGWYEWGRPRCTYGAACRGACANWMPRASAVHCVTGGSYNVVSMAFSYSSMACGQ